MQCVTYKLEKISQAIYIFKKTQFFKKLGSNLDLLFSKANYCHLFSNIFSVVNNLWCMCVCRTERSSKGLTQFYLQRKGQMIKKIGGYSFMQLMRSEALVKCFSEKFQFNISNKGHRGLYRPAYLKSLFFVVKRVCSIQIIFSLFSC